jgi:hypothetical protein
MRGQDVNTISGFVESMVCSQAMKKPATSAPSLRRCGVELVKNRDPAQQGGHRIGPTPEGLALERRRAVSSARSIGGRPLRLEETCCLETGLLLPASICHKPHVVIWHSGREFFRRGLSFMKTRDSTEVSESTGVGSRLFDAHENRPVVSAGRYVLLVRTAPQNRHNTHNTNQPPLTKMQETVVPVGIGASTSFQIFSPRWLPTPTVGWAESGPVHMLAHRSRKSALLPLLATSRLIVAVASLLRSNWTRRSEMQQGARLKSLIDADPGQLDEAAASA